MKAFENIPCSIYWWNFGGKTKDFVGTVQGYFDKRDIKVRKFTNKYGNKGYRFYISVSNTNCRLDVLDIDPVRAAFDAIKLFLSLMGDKTTCKVGYREVKMNWR